jgi:hypothetical protein
MGADRCVPKRQSGSVSQEVRRAASTPDDDLQLAIFRPERHQGTQSGGEAVTDNKRAYDEDIYEAYLLGCEDECLPEPKTREQFIEGWNRGMRSTTDNKPSAENARECLRELLYCLCIGEVHVDEGFNGPIYHYMWEDEPKALKILKEFATQQPDASKLAEKIDLIGSDVTCALISRIPDVHAIYADSIKREVVREVTRILSGGQ